MFPNEILTDRLALRWRTIADSEEIFSRYAHDPRVTRYLSWRPHQSVADTREFCLESLPEEQAGRSFGWLIRCRTTGQLFGAIGLRIDGHRANLGYCLAQDAWGRGIATEAATAIVAVAFADPRIERLESMCDVENVASAHVLEKIGLQLEGTLRRFLTLPNRDNRPRDVLCFAKVR